MAVRMTCNGVRLRGARTDSLGLATREAGGHQGGYSHSSVASAPVAARSRGSVYADKQDRSRATQSRGRDACRLGLRTRPHLQRAVREYVASSSDERSKTARFPTMTCAAHSHSAVDIGLSHSRHPARTYPGASGVLSVQLRPG